MQPAGACWCHSFCLALKVDLLRSSFRPSNDRMYFKVGKNSQLWWPVLLERTVKIIYTVKAVALLGLKTQRNEPLAKYERVIIEAKLIHWKRHIEWKWMLFNTKIIWSHGCFKWAMSGSKSCSCCLVPSETLHCSNAHSLCEYLCKISLGNPLYPNLS